MTNRAANATRAREQQVARWLEFAENQVPELLSPRRAAALDQMAGTYDALRETLRWLIERGDVERAARMVRALRSLWEDRGVDEGQRWVAAALAMPAAAARTAARATLLDHAAVLARGAGDHATALRLLSECLTIRRELGLTALLPVTLAH